MSNIVIEKIAFVTPNGEERVVGNYCHTLGRYRTVGETIRLWFTELAGEAKDDEERYTLAKDEIVRALEFNHGYTREEATLIFEAAYRHIEADEARILDALFLDLEREWDALKLRQGFNPLIVD